MAILILKIFSSNQRTKLFFFTYVFSCFIHFYHPPARLKTDIQFVKINIRKYINIYDTTELRSNQTNLSNSENWNQNVQKNVNQSFRFLTNKQLRNQSDSRKVFSPSRIREKTPSRPTFWSLPSNKNLVCRRERRVGIIVSSNQ